MNKRTIVGTLAVFMFLLIAIQTVTAAPSAKDLLKEGDNYFKQGNYSRAIESYESILSLYPKSKEANEAKKKLEGPELERYRYQQAQQAKASQKITEPLTDANFQVEQNQQGGITIKKYIGEKESGIRDLVIPAQIYGINVTAIAEDAFAKGGPSIRGPYRLSDEGEVFESVTIPPTVTAIGNRAFINRGIKTLTLPDSLRSIGAYAFAKNKLTSITMPANVTAIGEFAFMENQLSSVTLPTAITVIPRMAFAKNQLASIVIPSSVTQIGVGAFGGNQLTEVTIPENVTSIGACAFAANAISKLTFSNSGKLTSIGIAAFSRNQLRSVVLPEGLATIGSGTSVRFQSIFINQSGTGYMDMDLEEYFSIGPENGILGGNPLVYIKLPSTLGRSEGNHNYRAIARNTVIPAVEWLQPNASMFDNIERAVALKIGANITARDLQNIGFEQGFINFYASQGNKAGIYMRRGPLWVTATQEEFDAFIAEITK